MIATIEQYLESVATLLDYEEWDYAIDVAKLLSVRESHAEYPFLHVEDPVASLLKRFLESPFHAIVALHLRVLHLLSQERYEDAYKTQSQMITLFVKEVLQKRKDENWFLPICYRFCSDLRIIAKAADLKPSGTKRLEQSDYYEQSASAIMDCYRNCVADIRATYDISKRLSILNLTNQLFRIYFKINKLNLLKPLIRAIENCGKLYDEFSNADKITYNYYIGRKAMFDSDLETVAQLYSALKEFSQKSVSAESSLTLAFKRCPSAFEKNKRLILVYLIPVKMFLGHMPTRALLQKYNLMEFYEVAESVKQGNVLRLEEALAANEQFFIKCGIFLILEKLKIITYRTLFKKVCRLLGAHQVALDAFLVALRLMRVEDVDADETACIVANLIYQGRIKGYISHKHQKLVISKENAFPPLSTLAVA